MRDEPHSPAAPLDPWNLFDFVIVAIALLPVTGEFAVLRSLRILRALRLISAIPSMRRVVSGLLAALPGMASIAALLSAEHAAEEQIANREILTELRALRAELAELQRNAPNGGGD